ncbi:DNA-formamidopyrimidine glycosylase [Spiroplasma apis]|uniref:Formamidopyrimidine-DNA glycosylase n=1 Tax=Spiroplasma apis B31 TaxID=1276258 RepID=V5RLI2_SPIAP|nr:DNA-formamidopyrimidine glycosylase [Spiroplasma apis]AHB36700.1 formamidopyrimidine-DNA glycosylase [Spiroplasma apis B31]
MPELPEVETVVRLLRQKVKGEKIVNAKILYPNLLKTDISLSAFEVDIKNRVIEDVSRIAKHIIFHLGDMVLISHLRMEGKWFIYDDEVNYNKHLEAIFELESGKKMAYFDTRKFGTFHYQLKESYKELKPISNVGPEPFNPKVDANFLVKTIGKSNKFIKTALLDQTKLSGIGNIYADEILFKAKIHPLNRATSLKANNYEDILVASKEILTKAIELGGSTIDSYQMEDGIDGKFQNELKVHTRKNKPCYICGSTIEKIKVNGRGTYFCKVCQLMI